MTKACTSVVVANNNRMMVTVHSAIKPRYTSCVSFEKPFHRPAPPLRFLCIHTVIVTNEARSNSNGYNSGLTPKIAFLFPGQGSQFAGMGKALADTYPAARRVFEEADDALGFSLSHLSFEGPEEALSSPRTRSPAAQRLHCRLRVLGERGLAPDYVAGHSLGEYSALVAAGACASPTPCGWCASAASICSKPCRPAWAPWRRCSGCRKENWTRFWSGRPRARW